MTLFENVFSGKAMIVWTISHRKKYFGGKDDRFSPEGLDSFANNFFALAVNVGGVKEVYSFVKSKVDLLDRISLLNDLSIGKPAPQSNLADSDAPLSYVSILHSNVL